MMKWKLSLLCFALLIILISCEKKSASQIGSFYSAPIVATIGGTSEDTAVYYFMPKWVRYSNDTLSFYAIDSINAKSECPGYFEISLSVKAKTTGVYPLIYPTNAYTKNSGYCSMNTLFFSIDSLHTGSVNITKLDTTDDVVSGAFSFNANMVGPIRDGGTETVSKGSFTNLKW